MSSDKSTTTDNTDESTAESASETSLADTRGARAGKGIRNLASTVRHGIGASINGFLYGVTKVAPVGEQLWAKRHEKLLKKLYKSSSADAIGMVIQPNGKIQPQPVKWKSPEDADERGHWSALYTDGKWDSGTRGRQTARIGDIPVVFLDTDQWMESALELARIKEVVDLGQKKSVYSNPTINYQEIMVDPTASDGTQDGAVADGGTSVRSQFQVQSAGALEDVAIDYSSPDGYDGMVASWQDITDLFMEKTDSEEMKAQEMRGRMAEADPEKDRKRGRWYFKWSVISIIAAVALTMYVTGGGGGGGGGGGSLIPFMMQFGGLLKAGVIGL